MAVSGVIAAASAVKNLASKIFGGNIDIAKDMPKLFYQYTDTPTNSPQYRLFSAENYQAFKSWNEAYSVLQKAGAIDLLNSLDPKGKVHRNNSSDVKYFMAGNITKDGYPTVGVGWKGVIKSGGQEYDPNKISPTTVISSNLLQNNVAQQSAKIDMQNPSTMVAIAGLGIALALFFKKG